MRAQVCSEVKRSPASLAQPQMTRDTRKAVVGSAPRQTLSLTPAAPGPRHPAAVSPPRRNWLQMHPCPAQHLAQGRCSGAPECIHPVCPREAAGRTVATKPARLLRSPSSRSGGDKPPKSWSLRHKEEMLRAAGASNGDPSWGKGSRRGSHPRQRPLPETHERSRSPLWGWSGLGDACTCAEAPGRAGAEGRRVSPAVMGTH